MGPCRQHLPVPGRYGPELPGGEVRGRQGAEEPPRHRRLLLERWAGCGLGGSGGVCARLVHRREHGSADDRDGDHEAVGEPAEAGAVRVHVHRLGCAGAVLRTGEGVPDELRDRARAVDPAEPDGAAVGDQLVDQAGHPGPGLAGQVHLGLLLGHQHHAHRGLW